MNNKIYIPQPIVPVGKPQQKTQKSNTQVNAQGLSFDKVFQQQLTAQEPLKFSAHAQQRLQARNINLTDADLAKLDSAVQKAAEKGAKESLVVMNDVAFVVSVKNKTVITAVDGANMKENVFTNIDSAVIT